MDTDALLGMSLDDLIAAKGNEKLKTNTSGGGGGGGGGGGKMRSNTRSGRRQQSAPYVSNSKVVLNRGFGGSLYTNRVYVGNLSWECTWQVLKDHMRQAGRVVKADVAIDQQTGRSKVRSWHLR